LYKGLDNQDASVVTPKEQRLATPAALKVQLMEHQKLGLEWMMKCETTGENRGGILADDMGLGKTIQSIALMLSNRAEKAGNPTLIIAPVSLIHQWASEIMSKVRSSGNLRDIHIYHVWLLSL
jgi:SNF2 family DNA or RNA helicase